MSTPARQTPAALADRLAAVLVDGVQDDPGARGEAAIAGVVPALVACPADRAELAAAVAAVDRAGAALVPLGHGAHRALGHAPGRYDVALSTRRLDAIVEYTPADMTLTVEAGATLATVAERLATHGQWLPLEPPLPAATTIGGLVAADLGGPLVATYGRVRDYVIGIRVVGAAGRPARAGGKVVKNVAGYDLMKLFTGSLGTLGVIVEVTFKVRPRPPVRRVLVVACGDRAGGLALAAALAADAPDGLALALALPPAGARPHLLARLAGVEADVAAAAARLRATVVAHGGELSDDLAEDDAPALIAHGRDFVRAAPGALVVRLCALPARAPALAAALTAGAAEGAAQLDPRAGVLVLALPAADPGTLAAVAAQARAAGAQLVIERWPAALAATIEVWQPLPPALPLMRRLKAALDPQGTLAPGRFVGRI